VIREAWLREAAAARMRGRLKNKKFLRGSQKNRKKDRKQDCNQVNSQTTQGGYPSEEWSVSTDNETNWEKDYNMQPANDAMGE